MRSFILKFFLLLVIVYGSWYIWVAFFSMEFMNREYPWWLFQSKVISGEEVVPDVELLVLGDSKTMAAVRVNHLNNARSICFGGGTAIEAFYALEGWLQYHHPPKTVFLSLSPYHLCVQDQFWHRTVKFGFLDNRRFSEVVSVVKETKASDFLNRDGEKIRFPQIERLKYQFKWPAYYQADLRAGHFAGRGNQNRQFYAEIEETKGQVFFGTAESSTELGVEFELSSFKPDPVLGVYLKRLLDLCLQKKIMVIFDSMPFHTIAYAALPNEFRWGYTRYISQLQEQYPDFRISNGLKSWPNDRFGDRDHLNARGADELTRYFKEWGF